MKITLEPANLQENELIIRGNISSSEIENLLSFINNANTRGKLILHREDEQFFVDAKEIIYFESSDGKVIVHTQSGEYQSKQKLYEILETLKAKPFAQINKSIIVNIDFVKSVSAEFSGNYSLKLKTGNEVLTISRKYMKEFKEKI